jgi:hypothetical protein
MEDIDRLAARCLSHLKQEAAMLASSLQLVSETRRSLRHRDDVALQANLERQQQLASVAGRLQADRMALRHEIANQLAIAPQAATISAVARRAAEPLRSRLAERQRELRQTAIQVECTNRANQDLALRLMRLLSSFLGQLSTLELSTGRYSRTGRLAGPASASVFAKEC